MKPKEKKQTYRVTESTTVYIPSAEFPVVPYTVYLLQDGTGNRKLWKSNIQYKQGDTIDIDEKKQKVKRYKVGVIGAGTTGAGIAAVCLAAEFPVTLYVRNRSVWESKRKKIVDTLYVHAGIEKAESLKKLLTITDDWKLFYPMDIVIEAISEQLSEKISLYKILEKHIQQRTILATNTSSLSIDELGKELVYPSRFVGLHFFNPVVKMRLVEIMNAKNTDKKTVNFAKRLVLLLGKHPVILKNPSEGLIVNRILFALLAESVKIHNEGIATIEDIDAAIELGLNHPLGPFKLMDLIGLDVSYEIFLNLSSIDKKKINFSPLHKLITEGNLGRKSGKGFYNHKK